MAKDFSTPLLTAQGLSAATICKKQYNTLENDRLREELGIDPTKGKVRVVDFKKEIAAYMFSEDGPVARGEIEEADIINGPAGAGKTTWINASGKRDNPRIFIDASAGGLEKLYAEKCIPFLIEHGVKTNVLYMDCPLLDAFERNNTREATYDATGFLKKHENGQKYYKLAFERFKNSEDPQTKKLLSFKGIMNPRTEQEKSANPDPVEPPSFKAVQILEGDEIYGKMQNSKFPFDNDESIAEFREKYPDISFSLAPYSLPEAAPKRKPSDDKAKTATHSRPESPLKVTAAPGGSDVRPLAHGSGQPADPDRGSSKRFAKLLRIAGGYKDKMVNYKDQAKANLKKTAGRVGLPWPRGR